MKKLIASSVLACGIFATPALAQDAPVATTTTTVAPNADGGYNVNTIRTKVDAYGNAVQDNKNVSTDMSGSSDVSKRVERTSTDTYGNQTKEVTDHTTDPQGRQITTHVVQSTTGQ